jgi:hypothetical protein
MKLRTHKIPGIEKEVCTAEQKIAYNLAFAHYPSIQDAPTAAEALATAARRRDISLKELQKNGTRYNIDAIFCAYNAGIMDYTKAKYHIFTSYEEIGNAFPLLYPTE